MKKNEVFTGICLDYTEDGLGIVKQDSFVYFVKGLLKGETAKIKVISLKKNYGYGKVEEILTASKNRRESQCPYYPKCGGCQLLHMSYAEQLQLKENKVQQDLIKIAKLDIQVEPILQADEEFFYRNKVQIPLQMKDGKLIGGFYRSYSHDVVEMDACLLQSDLSNQIYAETLLLVKKYAMGSEIRHIMIKHGFTTNEVMLVLISLKRKIRNMDFLVKEITEAYPEIKSVVLNVKEKDDNVILGKENIVLYGQSTITDILLGKKFKISANSFYQVNPRQTEKLYAKAIEYADLKKEDVIADVYGGIGTIGICASDFVKKVYGVEIIEEAIEDAKENSRLNNISNTEYEAGDAGTVVEKWLQEGIQIDVAFIDPPRKGCDDLTIESLVKLQPRSIVYVSCDPATLARDLQKFDLLGYKTEKVQPLDMFPNTKHVETVVLMSRVEGK